MKKQHRNAAAFEQLEYDFSTGEYIPSPRSKSSVSRPPRVKTYRAVPTTDRSREEMEYKAIRSMYPLAFLILIIYLLKWLSET